MQIVLGSKSPRRQDLLSAMGYDFIVRTKDTDESYPSTLDIKEIPTFIASKKAHALKDTLSEDELLICADTIVALNGIVLGKPKDDEEANVMLSALSGQTHDVLTGVVILYRKEKIEFTVTTKVTFRTLADSEIEHYISHFNPFDKAGSYGIQDWIGLIAVDEIKGSYNNVVGLPTVELFAHLKNIL